MAAIQQHPVLTVPWVMDKAGVMVIVFGLTTNAYKKVQTPHIPKWGALQQPRSARRPTGGSASSHSSMGIQKGLIMSAPGIMHFGGMEITKLGVV